MVKTRERLTFDDFRRCIDAKSTGAVRVSLGLVSTFRDVQRFICFARWFRDLGVERLV
jgi:selenocysteine lyase/cysteine desulfurase